MSQYDCFAYTTGGVKLDAGDVVTGAANVAATYVINGIAKYYPCHAAGGEGYLYRWDGSAYTAVLDSSRGDGFFFVTPQASAPDRITVVACSTDEIELSVEWDAWDLDTGYLGTPGIGYRDFHNPGPGLNYEQSTATSKYITETRVVKSVIIRRGREGVFLGVHSDPRVGPFDCQIPSYNNATDWGEREFQLGVNIRVCFSSADVTALHPDDGAGTDAAWGGTAVRHQWLGIDDANYPPYDTAGYIANQPGGFPAEQTTGPWWIGALHYLNATTYPFCAYMILRERLEIASFQFSTSAYGQPTLHFANEAHDLANVPYRTMCFIGAFPYTSSALASEPTASLSAAVASRANTDFELSGQATLSPETTTIGDVRDAMIELLSSAAPRVITSRVYTPHREEIDFRTFCDATPSAAFRRFSISDTLNVDGPFVSNEDYRELHTTLEVVVAYPRQGAYRDDGAQNRPLLEMHDVIRQDLITLRDTVGIRGYAALERDGINAAVVGEDWTIENSPACVFSVLRLKTMYREDPTS